MTEASFTPALLRDIAGSVVQMKWPAKLFCDNLLSSGQNEIRAFLECTISSMWAYHEATHDYLLLCVDQSPSTPFVKDVWLRCERHPGSYTGGPLFLSLHIPGAADTVQLSYEVEWLKAPRPRDKLIMAAAGGPAKLRHLIDLLQIIQEESPQYALASLNCWWFAHVIFGTLVAYNDGVWMTHPEKPLVKKIVNAFGRDTKKITENVGRRFSSLWPPLNGQRALLNERRTWEGDTVTTLSPRRPFLRLPGFRRNTTDSMGTMYTPSDAPRLDWEPLVTPTESLVSVLLPGDTSSLDSVIRRVMTRAEPDNGEVLLTVYNAFTTGPELFDSLAAYYAEVTSGENNSAPIQLRIEDFMCKWATHEFLDLSVSQSLLDWLRVHRPLHDSTQLLVRRGIPGSSSDQGSFITLVPDKQFHVGEGTLLRLSDDELKMLAMELRANEYKLRSGLTPLYLMQALADHDQPEFPTSLNTTQIRRFVARAVLSGEIDKRFVNYQKAVKLAAYCKKDRNYASAQDIVDALTMPEIDGLTRTRRLAGMDSTLSKIRGKLPNRLSAPSPSTDDDGALYRLAPSEIDDLRRLFKQSFDGGQISWSTCRQLWEALRRIAPPGSSPTMPNFTSLHFFLTSALADTDPHLPTPSIEELAKSAKSRDDIEYTEWTSNS